jgi:hypothetical protein
LIELNAFRLQQSARILRLLSAQIGEIDVDPACEKILQVPGALAVAN